MTIPLCVVTPPVTLRDTGPRPGLLMLWPADILHEVHPFYGKDQRVVINFNISGRPEGSDN